MVPKIYRPTVGKVTPRPFAALRQSVGVGEYLHFEYLQQGGAEGDALCAKRRGMSTL